MPLAFGSGATATPDLRESTSTTPHIRMVLQNRVMGLGDQEAQASRCYPDWDSNLPLCPFSLHFPFTTLPLFVFDIKSSFLG